MIEQSILTRHRTAKRISKELLYGIVSNLTWNHIYSTVNDHCTLLNPVPLKIKNHHNLVIWVCFKSSHQRVLSQRNKELIYFTWGLLLLLVVIAISMSLYLKLTCFLEKFFQGLETGKLKIEPLLQKAWRIKDIGSRNICLSIFDQYCTVSRKHLTFVRSESAKNTVYTLSYLYKISSSNSDNNNITPSHLQIRKTKPLNSLHFQGRNSLHN